MISESKGIQNLEKLRQKLFPFLRRYLEERNVDVNSSGKFRCINPKHSDSSPSCSFVPDSNETVFHCFGCGCKGTIVEAAYLVEGKPINGPDFVKENLYYLAEKYGIEVLDISYTPEELELIRTYKAYDDASDIITETYPLEYITKRRWPVSVIRELRIGTVNSYADFISKMESRGHTRAFCEEIDLNSYIFNEGMLIFSIRDEYGKTVGFSSRDMNYAKENKGPKFINTSAKCPLYSKGAILYGIDIGKKHQPPLYIFEGYPDYVTAYRHNIKNVCAIGGTALTRDHINLIKHLGISDIILALDWDNAGQNRTETLLDEYFGGDETLNVKILDVKTGDPDEFINTHGSEEFLKIPKLTPFQWRLARFNYEAKPEHICDKMIPLIIGDSNEVHRETMCKELSEKTGVTLKTIQKQVAKELNAEEAEKDGVVQTKIRQLILDLKYQKGDPATLLDIASEEIRQVNAEGREDINSSVEVVRSIDVIRKSFEDRKPGLQGWKTGYEALDEKISGIPKQDAMITFAGDSNVGKCMKHNSMVLLSDGSYVSIEDVFKNKYSNIVKMDGHRLVPGTVSNWIDSGELECFKVTTESGLSTEPSATHPYYTINGWKNVADLKPGDSIAIASNYDCFNNIDNDLSFEQAEFLGYILAEGGITREVRFTNTDKEIVERFKELSEILFPGCKIRKENITYYITDKNIKNNRAMDWMRSLGLLGCDSHEKFIPDCIFKSSKDKIAVFLGAFYSCDGWVSPRETSGIEIGVSLCNRRMIEQIRSLLIRFRIKTKIVDGKSTCSGREFNRYSIAIHDYNNAFRFYENIRIPLKRKQLILGAYACSSINARGAYGDSFPCELWSYIENAANKKCMSMADLIGIADPDSICLYFDSSRNKYRRRTYVPKKNTNISLDLLTKVAFILGDDFLMSLSLGDIYFDEIVSIESIGGHHCYDLTVDGEHNFIVNDTIVHNTGFMFELSLRLARYNPNIMVLFMTIDDSRQQAIARLVALESGLRINQVSHPTQNIKSEEDMEKLNKGWASIRSLIDNNRFSIKDNLHGNTLDFAEGWIRWAKQEHKDKEICFFLDNFHKLGDERGSDERIRFKHASSRIHAMKNKLGFTAICTMELRKMLNGGAATRPSLQDISESKQMEYDNNLIGMVYSDVHARREDAKTFWEEEHGGVLVKKPVFEVDFQKNKVSDFKGCLYWKFSPEYSRFYEESGDKIAEWQKEYVAVMKQLKDKRHPEAGTNPFATGSISSI